MTKMKFGGFEFPYNPEKIRISMEKRIKAFSGIDGTDIVQDLGTRHRIITGSGTFFGDDAFAQMIKLQNGFKNDNPAVLTLPGFDPLFAELCSLDIKGEAGESTVNFEFMFREIPSEKTETAIASEKSCIAKVGDTLWSISAACGVSVEMLLQLNPYIVNPFSVIPGRQVMLR